MMKFPKPPIFFYFMVCFMPIMKWKPWIKIINNTGDCLKVDSVHEPAPYIAMEGCCVSDNIGSIDV